MCELCVKLCFNRTRIAPPPSSCSLVPQINPVRRVENLFYFAFAKLYMQPCSYRKHCELVCLSIILSTDERRRGKSFSVHFILRSRRKTILPRGVVCTIRYFTPTIT
uniref:Uncharacterized protein n=1 Tax=Sipha flava TaxID=143950 RepID=A0A2S2QDL8_9HEMI